MLGHFDPKALVKITLLKQRPPGTH